MSPQERKRLLALALIMLAVLLVVGGVLGFAATVNEAGQQLNNVVFTQAAEAGETAVRQHQLTQAAQ